ncbi:GbpC/Spa domain-containing protein, partial [Streptococcus ruminantium]|nr:GbpC/Spa domain-containing protein [Streptococcus ruminantium]
MTKKHNNRMFNVDERERFKKRKSKKYKNLCSVAVTTLTIVGVATATTVKADEVAGPEVTATEVVTTVTETETTTSVEVTPVIESPAPSTNLTEAQPEASQEATVVQEASDTQSGDIAVTNTSEELNTAVSQAEQEGVQVKEEVAKDYGVITSAEETAAKQAEIQADYAKQTEAITKTTETYVAEKEVHATATEKVVAENNQLKAEYDAKIAAYNAEVKKVNAENAAIDAAYDKARQAYEAEVAKIDVSNKAAKEQYEVALNSYKAEVQRISQENATKQASYETSLSEYNAQVKQVNAENQQLEDQYQAAYKLYKETVEQVQSANAEREKVYNQALATYLAEVERINRENEEKRQAYEKAKAKQDSNLAEIEAENKLIEQRNQAAKDAYSKAMSVYRTEKERYDKRVAEAEANTSKEGWLKEAVSQSLFYESEPDATVRSSGNVKFINEEGISELTKILSPLTGTGFHTSEIGLVKETQNVLNNNRYYQSSIPTSPFFRMKNGENVYLTTFNVDDTVTLTQTNLINSTFNGRKLSKVEVDISIDKASSLNLGSDVIYLSYTDDFAKGFEIGSYRTDGTTDYKFKVDILPRFYDEDGNLIDHSIAGNTALLGFSSLNYHTNHVEGITASQGSRVVEVNGSSITNHGGIYRADKENTWNVYGEASIDSEDSPNFWRLGAGVVVDGKNPKIGILVATPSVYGETQEGSYLNSVWFTLTSKFQVSGGIVGTPPKMPVLKLEEFKIPTVTPPTKPTYEKLPEAPIVSYIPAPEAPTKPESKPLPKK